MVHVLEVTAYDINQLDEKRLTDLLLRLLRMEAQKYGIHKSCIDGSLEVKATDGGEDAHIKWSGGVEKTGWIPNRYTLFQCKAEDMEPTKCKKEILSKGELKPRVKEVLDNGGSYVLFFTQKCNTKMKIKREKEIREGIQSTGASYFDNVSILIYDANSISMWVNEYVSLIVQVCSWFGRYLPYSICAWQDWNKYCENNIEYVKDEIIEGHISQLRSHFIESKKVARIVGLSGLGKTRLALEVFRPPDNVKDEFKCQTISDQVVYIDASIDTIELPSTIKQWREQKLEGILVVDNCGLELHKRLKREIEHSDSRLSLLTLDYNPESSDERYIINLKRASNNVIKGIVTQSYPRLADLDISRIVEFADGFPQMAVMLAEARLHEVTDIGNLTDDVLRDKLLWGRRPENETARKVIGACSLFTHLGFSEDVVNQRYFVAEKICNISDADFHEYAVDFIERGILDRRNRFVRVVPIPLAVRLAADWWKRCSFEKAKELIAGEMPAEMAEALCDQISKLHYVHEARKLTEELCGNSAPFGQAEVLNSEKGSRLFRSLVEVNPQATVEAFNRAFGDYSKEQLLEVGPGRRNLIWALEKLCFWEETFPIASRIMLSFAVSENETWGNNATNQFLQLFHYILSGTQAQPKLRLEVIDEALESYDIDYKVLGVKALGHSLMSYHLSRMVGVECQGSRLPQEEWRPKLLSDIFDYWRESLKRLIPLCCEDNELAKLARKQIVDNIRGLVQYGLMEDIEVALIKISKESNIFWPEAYNEIEESIIYEGTEIPSEGLSRLKSWLEILKPLSLGEKLKLIVSTPSDTFEKNEKGNRVNLSHDKAILLAKECSRNITQLVKFLNVLFEGNQTNGFTFGYTLGENLITPKAFIENSFYTMKKINSKVTNPEVLGGFLSSIKPNFPELVEKTLDDVSQDEVLYIHTIYLTRCIVPDQKDLNRIVKLIKTGKIKVNDSRMLGVSHLSPEIVMSFCNELVQFGHEGFLSALEILFHYTVKKSNKFEICKEEIRKILMTPGIISSFDRNKLMDDYYLSELIEIFLFKENEDLDLASHISNEIIAICSKDVNIYLFKSFLEPIIQELLLRYKDITWPIFGAGLLSENLTLKYNIMGLFDSLNNSEDSNKSILSEVTPEFLIEWCRKEPNKAPLLIAKMVPIFTKIGDNWSLHPLAKSLVDNYGDRPDVLLEIDRNLGTFSWSGSVIPYYKKQIEIMMQLSDHNIPTVRKWARKNIKDLEKEIIAEKKREEEQDLGIF